MWKKTHSSNHSREMTLNHTDEYLQHYHPQHKQQPSVHRSCCLLAPASRTTRSIKTQKQWPKFASGHINVETSHICIYSFKYFAHSAGNGWYCTSIKALKGCMLFCTFYRGDSQCAWLVDQLPHLFVCDIIFAQVAFLPFYFLSPEASYLLIDTNANAHYSELNKHEA